MRIAVVLAALAFVAAPLMGQDTTQKKKKKDPNVITFEEIQAIQNEAKTALEVVQKLRPHFLRQRGTGSGRASEPRVVVDGAPRGDKSALSEVGAVYIKEIRYMGGNDATIRFGTGYDGGAIVVTTK